MSTLQWGALGSVSNLIVNATIASLAKNTISTLTEFDNTTGKVQRIQLTLNLGSAAFAAGDYVQIICVPSSDGAGTAYPTLDINNMANYVRSTLYLRAATAAQLEMDPFIEMPIGKSKWGIYAAVTPATLAATGNTLDAYSTPDAIV